MPRAGPIGKAAACTAAAAAASRSSRRTPIATACSAASSAWRMSPPAPTASTSRKLLARARSRSSSASSTRCWRRCSTSRPCAGPRRAASSLYGLGIPPAQYEALAGGRDMGAVLRDRVERLACGFSLSDNYFAWQAFGRAYARDASGPLPPYLQAGEFRRGEARRRAGRGDEPLGDRTISPPVPRARATAMCCSMRRTG